jgi:hypothetical protein
VLIKNTQLVDRVNGADVPALNKKIRQHCSSPLAASAAPVKEVNYDVFLWSWLISLNVIQDLNTRLKNLINRAPVMLFMKGVPEAPRCGEFVASGVKT